ncbi:hypothetical protein GWO09_17280 [candidate division KSB1 bacterium]|nr:hypothetical protein [candidate division KSB1 bacterium]
MSAREFTSFQISNIFGSYFEVDCFRVKFAKQPVLFRRLQDNHLQRAIIRQVGVLNGKWRRL